MDSLNQSLVSACWIAIGASVQGSHHIRDNQPRQDAFGIRLAASETILIAVADGVGSAAQSGIGSQLAVTTSLDWLEANLWQSCPDNDGDWDYLFRQAFIKARVRIEELASLQNLNPGDFATTLLLAAASGGNLVTGQIGDGAIVAKGSDGLLSTISQP